MKKTQSALIITLFFLCAPRAHSAEGAVNGGGGKGVYCSNLNGALTSLTLLDLYEARRTPGWNGMPELTNFDAQKQALGRKLAVVFGIDEQQALGMIQQTYSAIRFLPVGQRVAPIDDADENILDPHCHSVQIAHFYGQPMGEIKGPELPQGPSYWVDVDTEYWNALSPLNQVALVVHEMIYEQQREQGAETSSGARTITRFVLSDKAAEPIELGLPQSAVLFCHSLSGPATYFKVYEAPLNGQPIIVAQFSFVLGVPVFTKTTAYFRNVNLEFFESKGTQFGKTISQVASPLYGNQFDGDAIQLIKNNYSDGSMDFNATGTVPDAPGVQSGSIVCGAN